MSLGGAHAVMAAISNARAAEGTGASLFGTAASGSAVNINAGSGSPLASAMGSGTIQTAFSDARDTLSSTHSTLGSPTPGDTTGTGYDGRSETGQGTEDSDSTGKVNRGSLVKAAGTVAAKLSRVAAGAASNLALGSVDVAKSKLEYMKDSALERISDTAGGKIAAAIKARSLPGEAPNFGSDSLSVEPQSANRKSDVDTFRERS